jgi:hypothetical protein
MKREEASFLIKWAASGPVASTESAQRLVSEPQRAKQKVSASDDNSNPVVEQLLNSCSVPGGMHPNNFQYCINAAT